MLIVSLRVHRVNVAEYCWRHQRVAKAHWGAAGKRSMPDTSKGTGSSSDAVVSSTRAEGIVDGHLAKTKSIGGDGNARVLDKTEGPGL